MYKMLCWNIVYKYIIYRERHCTVVSYVGSHILTTLW